jgi:membrane protease YdiL (CAAX protease family)
VGAVSESNDRREEPLFEAPDVEVPADAGGDGVTVVEPGVDAGAPATNDGDLLEEAPDVEVPSDAPAPPLARSSRFSRSESGAWVAHRFSDDPAAADAATGLLVADGASEAAAGDADAAPRRRRRPSAPRVWLQGGTTTVSWGWLLVGWAVVSLGAGVLVATAAGQFIGGVVGGWVGTVVLWIAMIVPVLYAFSRSVPRGLLRFRPTDLLFGVVFGVALRIVSGWLDQAASGVAVWPSYPTIDGQLSGDWWFVELAIPVVIAPLVEEFFFHALLLVALYTAFRRLTRVRAAAGFGAALVSTGLFVLLHALTGSLGATWASSATIALVGLVGAAVVLLTGRVWGAVLTHVVFNGTYVVLAVAGTLAGLGGGGVTLA